MRPIYVSQTGTGSTAPIPLDIQQVPFAIGIGCIVTGTVNYTVEHTYDDITAGAPTVWFSNSGITAKTANADGNYAFPVRAIRLTLNSGTGSVQMAVLQGAGGS